MSNDKLRDHVELAYQNALIRKSKLTEEILSLEGMSGKMTRHFYNNLLSDPNTVYLEIGTWMGSSSASAMFGNKADVTLMDNFSGFGGPKEKCMENIEKYKGENKVEFFEDDCFTFDLNKFKKKFNAYLFDADHSEQSQFMALDYYLPAMQETFVYICDDWNWKDVREGTIRAINKNKLRILYTRDIDTPEIEPESFWNGMAIFILQKTQI